VRQTETMKDDVQLDEKYAEKFSKINAKDQFWQYRLQNLEREEFIDEIDEESREEAREILEEYESEQRTNLEDVHKAFNKWMELEDTKRIDVTLAVALSNKSEELKPLWLILVGPSGCGKTEQIKALRDPFENELPEEADTKRISEITQNTLVSGMKGPDKDLAPKLEGKLILIYDFATILNLPSEPKRKVWSQLRELYDGRIGKQAGSGKDVDYLLEPAPSFIACSTPDIDMQLIQKDKLGTRELIYRIEEPEKEDMDDVLDQVWNDHADGKTKEDELNSTVRRFLDEKEPNIEMEIPEEVVEKLKLQAERLSYMRAQGDFDNYTNELEGKVTREVPTRALDQLKSFYICLMSLSPDYEERRALEVIEHIVRSSGNPRREKVIGELAYRGETTGYSISQSLRISPDPIQRDLQILWNLGLVNRKTKERENGDKVELWEIDETHELYDLLTSRPLTEKIKETIEKRDKGEGAQEEEIFEEFKKEENRAEDALELLTEQGEIMEIASGKYQVAS
jgi:predicted transcriptional regulator